MNEYFVEFDGIDGCGSHYFSTDNYGELIEMVEETLDSYGGGHADIYDEDGDFVDDVEI